MNRLLKAALYRLKLQKLFWVLLVASFGLRELSLVLFLFPKNDLDGSFS